MGAVQIPAWQAGHFGVSVAIDGDTAVVGEPQAASGGTNRGEVHVFRLVDGTWSLEQTLTPTTPEDGAFFGQAVALSGATIFVGCPYQDNGGTSRGSIYVFTRTGTIWTESQELQSTVNDEYLGYALATDGVKLVAGAPGVFSSGFGGRAYVYIENGTWSEETNFQGSGTGTGDQFGFAVDIDGDTIVVGAHYGDWNPREGEAYVFLYSGSWSQQQMLTPNAASDGRFGCAVSVVGDTCIVGARRAIPAPEFGSADVWTRSGTTWTRIQNLHASDESNNNNFGWSTCLVSETRVFVGGLAAGTGSAGGSVYEFKLVGGTWSETNHLSWDPSNAGDGSAYSIAFEGDHLIVGGDNVGTGTYGGLKIFWNPPELQNEDPAPDSTGNSRNATISGDVVDADGDLAPTTVKFWVNNTLAFIVDTATVGWSGSRSVVADGFHYSFTPTDDMPLIEGENTVRVYAEDDSGQILDESWTFSVKVFVEDVESTAPGEEDTGLDLKLATDDHDVVVEDYDLQLVAGVDEVAQHLLVALRLFLGEWYLDEEAGMAYYRDVFIAAPSTRVIETLFRQTILSDDDIEHLKEFSMDVNRATRKLDVAFTAISSIGPVEVDAVFP